MQVSAMSSHRPNFPNKLKRIRSLVIAAVIAMLIPGVTLLHEISTNGIPVYGTASIFSETPELLLMGVGLVGSSLYGELMRKQKRPWQKELLGKSCIGYIMSITLLFVLVSTTGSPQTEEGVYFLANTILNVYIAGVVLCVCCIFAGKS